MPIGFKGTRRMGDYWPNWGIHQNKQRKKVKTHSNNFAPPQTSFRTNAADDMYYSLLPGNLENLSQSPFNASLPTLVIFHGFTGSGEQEWVRDTKTG